MRDPKVPATALSSPSAVRPERATVREHRVRQQARRHSERLVAEWLRRLSTRRS